MKKRFLLVILAFFLILPLISAMNLKIEEKTSDVAMILGLEMPALFDLKITNLGEPDYFMFYNFFGSDTLPKGTVMIGMSETKDVIVGIYPREDLRQEGRIKFDVYIKGNSGEQMTYPLMVNAVKLKNVFEVGAEEFEPDSNTVKVYMKNTVNFNFNNLKARFKSPFFDFEKTFSLSPYQKESFEVSLNKEDFKNLMAGFYTLDVGVSIGGPKEEGRGIIRFTEKDIVTSSQNEYGVIVYTKRITKVNEGNTVSDSFIGNSSCYCNSNTDKAVLKNKLISEKESQFRQGKRRGICIESFCNNKREKIY